MSETLESLTRRLIDAETEKRNYNKDMGELIKAIKAQIAEMVKEK